MAVRVRTSTLALAVALAALLLAPGAASAKHCPGHSRSPAGNSQSDQYAETVPGACGHDASGGGFSHGSPGTTPPATQQQLQSLGPAGRATSTFAQETSPGGKALRRAARTPGASGVRVPAGKGDGTSLGSVLAALSRALTGDSSGGGVGILLPLVLAAVTAGGIAIFVRRRRAGQAS